MKCFSQIKLLSTLLFVLLGFTACDNFELPARKIQRQLYKQQQRAEELTEQLSQALESNNFNSIPSEIQAEEDILFYVYRNNQLVYWTDSWLSSSYMPLKDVFDDWQYAHWNNAHGICKRTYVGDYYVLTVIPVKYDYHVTSEILENCFVHPFKGDPAWGITLRQNQGEDVYPIYSESGEYLFSIQYQGVVSSLREKFTVQNFSYQSILASEKHEESSSRDKLFVYYVFNIRDKLSFRKC